MVLIKVHEAKDFGSTPTRFSTTSALLLVRQAWKAPCTLKHHHYIYLLLRATHLLLLLDLLPFGAFILALRHKLQMEIGLLMQESR